MAQVASIELQGSPPHSPVGSIYASNTSASSVEELTHEPNKAPASSIYKYTTYTIKDHLSTLRSIQNDDFKNERGIDALPRRRNKSQRPLALELSKALFPEMPEIAAIIQYERLTIPAKAIVRQNQKERAKAQAQPTNNSGGKLLKIQGPWAGQELDPVDLKGPVAIPMPVTIGDATEFEPIFGFLAENKAITDAGDVNGTHGLELLWKNPILEFKRGIVYEDGRLDLCKKVVGPTHIGKLMESLEPNEHIRHFLLGNNAISTTGAKHVAEFIRKYPNRMETWYLAGCHLTRHGLSLLVPHMMASTSITNLWFKRNPFGPNSSSLLSELVLRTANLRTLDLETTELGDEGVRQFIDGICGRPNSLQHLYLNANGIGQNACASLAKYLADPHCKLESLFLSTNPIGDAGMRLLAPGISINKTLKRLTCASAGLTSKGVIVLSNAVTEGAGHPHLETVDLGASQTTVAHRQKFNYLDDDCVEALKSLIMLPSLRWLNLGRTVLTATGLQSIKDAAAQSQLVYFNIHRVEMSKKAASTTASNPKTEMYEGSNPVARSCSLEVRNRMAKNQTKYYPHIPDYDTFLSSEEMRFLRNTSDVRQIDSMYRTRDKRLGIDMQQEWDEGDLTWKLIVDDAKNAQIAESI